MSSMSDCEYQTDMMIHALSLIFYVLDPNATTTLHGCIELMSGVSVTAHVIWCPLSLSPATSRVTGERIDQVLCCVITVFADIHVIILRQHLIR